MAGSLTVVGLDEVLGKFNAIGEQAEAVASMSLWEGAKVVADEYNRTLASIPAEEFVYVFNGEKRNASIEEKAALIGSAGVAKFQKSGSEVQTIIGTKNAYATIAGKQVPVKLLLRAINSGTSFRHKNPFIRKIKSTAKGAAQVAIVNKGNAMLETLLK